MKKNEFIDSQDIGCVCKLRSVLHILMAKCLHIVTKSKCWPKYIPVGYMVNRYMAIHSCNKCQRPVSLKICQSKLYLY